MVPSQPEDQHAGELQSTVSTAVLISSELSLLSDDTELSRSSIITAPMLDSCMVYNRVLGLK